MNKEKLKILGKVGIPTISKLPPIFNDASSVYFAAFAEECIPLNTKFSKIRDKNGLTENCNIELVKVMQQFGKEFSEIPRGWKTIVELKIQACKTTSAIKDLPEIDDWYSNTHFFVLEI